MSSKTSTQKFEFVTLTGRPTKAVDDKARRRIVRTHAKRYSLESHVQPSYPQTKRTSDDISLYTGRFHLQVVPELENERPERAKIGREHHKLLTPGEPDQVYTVENQYFGYARRWPVHRDVFAQNLSIESLDPFGTLPITVSSQEEVLFHYGEYTESKVPPRLGC